MWFSTTFSSSHLTSSSTPKYVLRDLMAYVQSLKMGSSFHVYLLEGESFSVCFAHFRHVYRRIASSLEATCGSVVTWMHEASRPPTLSTELSFEWTWTIFTRLAGIGTFLETLLAPGQIFYVFGLDLPAEFQFEYLRLNVSRFFRNI